MWNTTNNTNSNNNNYNTFLNVPACGIIQKSNANSFFLSMHQESKLADTLFTENPKYREVEVVILQVLLTHESWFLVEVVQIDKL